MFVRSLEKGNRQKAREKSHVQVAHVVESSVLILYVSYYRYHTGSLAFGSLIIAIVQLIRAALEYLDHKLRGNVYLTDSTCLQVLYGGFVTLVCVLTMILLCLFRAWRAESVSEVHYKVRR